MSLLPTVTILLCWAYPFLSNSLDEDLLNPRLYGDPLTDATPVEIDRIINEPADYVSREVIVEGTVGAVCQNRGCWMYITDGNERIRVDFKDYSFFVPMDSEGLRVRAQGTLHLKKVKKETLQHWAEEEEGADPSAITEDAEIIILTATGVLMENGTELSPEQRELMKAKD